MRIIAGDIGGTKTLLQVVEVRDRDRIVVAEKRYESEKWKTFDELVSDFLSEAAAGPIECACFAVAGPVLHNRAELTNLRWVMVHSELERGFGLRHVSLVNDFYAVAVGIPYLADDDVVSINAGQRDRSSPIAILGAGTGLGEAFLVPDEIGWRVIASEGGHADFAPVTEDHIDLLRHLQKRFGRVSYERVLSGRGLANVFEFLRERAGLQPLEVSEDELPPLIASMARSGDAIARRTMEIFAEVYGAEAGNLALKVLARGGVYLAGGIVAKNAEHFTDGRFRELFITKGRFSSLVAECPVDLITNAAVGLLGATIIAMRDCGGIPLHRNR
ncbi:MAG TPA: glucokinase [Thermoanaerobaculia bacterium]|nr:glucokinase [Thermoanaerobaculia bacterium]